MAKYEILKDLGWPFLAARHFKIDFDEFDVKYINNVIKNDKIYLMLVMADKRWEYTVMQDVVADNKNDGLNVVSHDNGNLMMFIEKCNIIYFFSKFLDDPQCPKRVKYFLYNYVGMKLEEIKESGAYNYFLQRSFFTERWMEICR